VGILLHSAWDHALIHLGCIIYAPFVVLIGALIAETWIPVTRCPMHLTGIPVLQSCLPAVYIQLRSYRRIVSFTVVKPVRIPAVNGCSSYFYPVLLQDIVRRPYLLLISLPFLLAGISQRRSLWIRWIHGSTDCYQV